MSTGLYRAITDSLIEATHASKIGASFSTASLGRTAHMRANRMLHVPGAKPYDTVASGPASFVPFAQIPQPSHYGLVASFRLSLAERLAEFGLDCEREYDELQGGWYRIIGIALPSGRFAFVQEFEHHPAEVELNLPVWRDVHLYREDFFAAKELLSVPTERITLCDGPFLWR